MKKVFTGDLISYSTQLNVSDEIKRACRARSSLAIGAAIMWLFVAIVLRALQRGAAPASSPTASSPCSR